MLLSAGLLVIASLTYRLARRPTLDH
jgi:hypothetical protein